MDRRDFLKTASFAGLGVILPPGCVLPGQPEVGGMLKPMAPSEFQVVARNLVRPEGVAVGKDGRVYMSNENSAIAILECDGTVRHVGEGSAANGVAIDAQGRIVLANFGLLNGKAGSLQRLDPATGGMETLAAEIDGRPLVASNFPAIARDGSIYCTHSTWGPAANIGTTEAGGFIYRVTPDGRISVATPALRGPNGCCFDRDERYLYVALTAAGKIQRMRRMPDGSLGQPEDYGPVLGSVTPNAMIADILKLSREERRLLGYPDGIAFDAAGNLWISLPFANRIVALTPQREVIELLSDPEGALMKLPTNLAWGGRDMRDLYIVSRGNGSVVKARTAVAGLPLVQMR